MRTPLKKYLVIFLIIIVAVGSGFYAYTSATAKVNPEELHAFIENITSGNQKQVLESLEDNSKLLKAETEDGRRPLEYAIAYQEYAIANKLLEKNAKISEQSAMPLFVQLSLSLNDSIQLEGNPDMQKDAVKLFKTAIKQDKDQLNLVDNEGNTALHYASLKGNDEVVKLLLEEGISPAVTNKTGETALAYAVQSGKTKVCEQLIKADKKQVNVVDKSGNSLLISAVLNGRSDIVSLLLTHNIAVDTKDKAKKTGLMYASEFGNVEVVNLLLKAGANAALKSPEGITAYGYAKEWKHEDVMDTLKNSAD